MYTVFRKKQPELYVDLCKNCRKHRYGIKDFFYNINVGLSRQFTAAEDVIMT